MECFEYLIFGLGGRFWFFSGFLKEMEERVLALIYLSKLLDKRFGGDAC